MSKIIAPGTTSYTGFRFTLVDDSGLPLTGKLAADMPDIYYSTGANSAAQKITLSDLATIATAYSSGGVVEDSGSAGRYRLDLPDAALATADRDITVYGEASGKHVVEAEGISVRYVESDVEQWKGSTAPANTGDAYSVVNNGTYGNSALLSAIQNVQNNTFIATSIPGTLEVPDSGSTTINISIVFSDETGAAKNLDSGDPTITLVNDAGTDKSARLGAWTNPATGKYVVPYTNTSGDTLEGLHWDVTGTINSKLRRMVAYTQLVDTTAVDFTSSDRTTLDGLATTLGVAGAGLSNLGDARLAHLNADVSSRAAPGDAMTLSGDFTATMKTSLDAATPAVTVSDKTGFSLASSGIDAILIESGITAGTSLENDSGSQLTSINARQLLALFGAALAGVLAGGGTTSITIKPAGKGSASARISATVDGSGNRSAIVLVVPD